jgi:hypothetical protein
LLSFCVSGLPSFASLLDHLAAGKLPDVLPARVSGQAFYQRLVALGHDRFLLLLRATTAALRVSPGRRSWVVDLAPWASGIFAIDDTTLDALVRRLPWLAAVPKGHATTLAGRLGTMLDLTTGKLHEVVFDPDSKANEKTHLWPLLTHVAQGALLVLDRGYFAFPIFDELTSRGLFFVTRLRAKTSYQIQQVLVDQPLYRDRIITLGIHRADRAAHPVRLVELCLAGKWWGYLTNVLDPHKLPAEKVWRLYLERWTIEEVFQTLKRVLGLAELRCSTQDGVLAQVWTSLTVYQVVQDLRLDIAHARGVGADDLSWVRVMRHLAIYTQKASPKPPLREWLGASARLVKQGTRKRGAKELPKEVAAACQQGQASVPKVGPVPKRKARQGKPAPRKKGPELTVGGLSVGSKAGENPA